MKRLVSFVLALVLAFSSALVISAESTNNNNSYISETLLRNRDALVISEQEQELSAMRSVDAFDEINQVILDIAEDKSSLNLSFESQGIMYEGGLIGSAVDVNNDQSGYVGVYEGEVSSYCEGVQIGDILIIADVVFNSEEIFAILTVGEFTQYDSPCVLCFGVLTDNLAELSSTYAERRMAENSTNITTFDEAVSAGAQVASVNTTLAYQAGSRVTCGSYVCGRLSVFHGDETSNGLTSRVHAKVNTNTTGFLNYLRNEYGYGDMVNQYALSTTPDRITVSISANDAAFYNTYYTPTEQAQTYTITVPVYLGSALGVQLISIDIVATSIGVTRSYYDASSMAENVINWTFNSSDGWEDTLDGDSTTQSGLAVMGTFIYDDEVTSNIVETITSKMTIRYEYYVQTQSSTFALHMTTSTLTVNSAITVVPG